MENDEELTGVDESTKVAQLKQWLHANRQALLDAGVSVIEGTYQGEGDEGLFQGITTLNAEGLQLDYSVPEEIVDLIEGLAEDLAPADYEIGDGGGGELSLRVEDASITHEAYWFVIERSSQGIETY